MDKDIDLRYVKIKSRIEVNQTLELGQDLVIALKGSVVKEEIADNQDGSVTIVYVVKPTESKIE